MGVSDGGHSDWLAPFAPEQWLSQASGLQTLEVGARTKQG